MYAGKFYGDGSSLSGLGGTLSGGQVPRLSYWTADDTLGNSNLSRDSATSLTAVGSSFTVQGALGVSGNISGAGNIQFGTQANKATLTYATNAARTLTIPALGGDRTFAFIDQAQTFSAAQAFAGMTNSGAYTQSGASLNTFTGASTFTGAVTGSSFTATGIGVRASQVRLADATGVVISSEASAALGGGVRVSTNVYVVGFTSATAMYAGKFYGDGSSLSGLGGTLSGGQAPRLPYWTADDTLGNSNLSRDSAASLTAVNSTFTVQGNAFSVGGSTLTVASGRVGVGVASPSYKFEVQDSGAMSFQVNPQSGYVSLRIDDSEVVRMRP
jgi:hypothetical protein